MPVSLTSHQRGALWLRGIFWTGLMCLASCARQLVSPQAKAGLTADFDYFLLVRQWPGSYCSKHDCPLLRDRGFHFTIHGLWPNRNDGTWPQFCDPDSAFNEDDLTDLSVEMENEWPNTFMDSNAAFWEHEWLKHGTCAADIFPTEYSYFDTVLMLHMQYNLQDALTAAGIAPSKDAVYSTKDLVDTIADTYGARPMVHCDENGQLAEIWMCLDRGLQLVHCDIFVHISDGTTCETVTIPPLSEEGSRKETVSGLKEVGAVKYGGSTADDSVYWVLDPDIAAASLLSGAGGYEAGGSEGDGAELTEDTTFNYLYGDAFPVVQQDDSAHVLEQLDIQMIEQRLLEHDDQMAAKSVPMGVSGIAVGCSGDRSVGAAAAALMDAATRAFVQLRQQLYDMAGGSCWLCGVDHRAAADVELEDEPRPNGGAIAAAKGGAQDFVWASKLRQGPDEVVAFDADDAGGRAAVVDGGGADADATSAPSDAATLAVIADRSDTGAAALWAVQGVLVLPAKASDRGSGGGGGGADGVNVGGRPPRPPIWILLLLTFQVMGIVVVALSLAVMAGMALVGVKRVRGDRRTTADRLDLILDLDYLDPAKGPESALAKERGCWGRKHQHCQQQQQQKQEEEEEENEEENEEGGQLGHGLWCSTISSPLCGLRKEKMHNHDGDDLTAPLLLYDSDDDVDDDDNDDDSCGAVAVAAPPKIHLAVRGGSSFGREEEKGREMEGQLRPQPPPLYQQQQPHEEGGAVNPLHSAELAGGALGAVLLQALPSRPSVRLQQQQQLSPPLYAPVQ
ncbi:hypothetical protein Vretimale_11413 [Volvox reticuliferus]|uniref:Uncharacterized protein n=1 Tax=Volvox reticuliferus TaxID=1737510 RepID=A0A8J4GHH5_9CHLO|nr:hypothetical protein Vretifemale_11902 [Volvox reticuliferus]GIM07307.1 hypothetical protein Vretimale_11413 [Volvox reticuliferus]